jgi:hypothetical protein
MTHFSGGCLCGAVRYVGKGKPELTFYCHCVDCQKESGGAFSVEIYLERNVVTIEGDTVEYDVEGETGNRVTREFCAVCGCPLFLVSDGYPEHICIKAGSLDDASWLTPEMHIYTASKLPWLQINDGLPQFEGDMEE